MADGALRGSAVAVGILGAGMILDWWLELPRLARLVLAVLNLAATGAVLVRWLGIPFLRMPRQDALALYVERRRPELRSRLISALQLARLPLDDPGAGAFVDRLTRDACEAARSLDPSSLVPGRSLQRTLRAVVPLFVAAALIAVAGWPDTAVLFRRACLEELPVPRKTHFLSITGPRSIGRGDDLAIEAVVEGVVPKSGDLILRHASGRLQTLSLDADPKRRGRFERVLANLPASFEYRIRVYDAESPEFRVEVLPRPAATNLVITQHLPAYTGLPDRVLPPSEMVVLRGSALHLAGVASQPLRSAAIRLGGLDRIVNASVSTNAPSRFDGGFLAEDPRLSSFTLDLVDAAGIASRDSAVYAIQVAADRPPAVRMILPARREELATSRGTVLLSFEAVDDFGLASLRLRHEPAGSTNGAPSAIEMDLAGESPATVRRRFEWSLSSVKPPPPEGALIEFWIEAADRNTVDGPGIGRSQHYLLRVVSEAEKRADLLGRAGDAIGRLGGVAQGQERLNESLGRIILAKPPGP